MNSIKIGSMNCRGLSSDQVKRRDIFLKCRTQYDITFLIDTHTDKNTEHLWKTEWGGEAKFSSHTSNSRGVAILFKNTFDYKIFNEILDPDGNFIILDIAIQGTRLSLAALYGPNADTPSFFDNIQNKLEIIGNTSVIISGDWNVPINYSLDTLNYLHKNNQKSNEAIKKLIGGFDLIDAWRELHLHERKYTWFGPMKKRSRLDYFLISSDLQYNLVNANIGYVYRSDHSPVNIELKFTTQIQGPGTWKFNNSLLSDTEYIQIVKNCVLETITQYKTDGNDDIEHATYSINDQLLWEIMKVMIRGKTISYSSFKKKERDKEEKQLEEKLKKLYESKDYDLVKQQIGITELQLKELREKKVKGIIVRAKSKWKVEGEKSSRYFCNLEKRNYVDKTIQKLTGDDGTEIDNLPDIISEQKQYYEKLYSSKNTKIEEIHKNNFMQNDNPFIQKLNDGERDAMEQDISIAECHKALKNMNNGRSPGIDGYTTEFYKFFWSDLKYFIVRSFNYSFTNQCMSVSQRRGLITCLPKEGKDKSLLKNWRPISLLNVDYKIASACIANRIKVHLSNMISETQQGFVKNRFIGECTRLVFDLIEKNRKRTNTRITLTFGLRKGF